MGAIRRLFATFLLVALSLGAQAALLGVQPGLPNTFFNSTGVTSYNPVTGELRITATPLATQFIATDPSLAVAAPRSLAITVRLNGSGALTGVPTATDFVMTGNVGAYSGTLLTGSVAAFGWQNSGTTDYFDFRFAVTGGSMAPLFAGQDIGVTVASEGSTFAGSFTVGFGGGAKGNVGPIPRPPVCSGRIGDFVWNDANRNGLQDIGEFGINGVRLTLRDAGNNVIGTFITTSAPISGMPGYYQFTGLCAGTYTVTVDPTTIPAGFVPSPTNVPPNPALDSNPSPATVVLPADNSEDQTIDFGYNHPVCASSIGNFVWLDTNLNGVQDAGEPGIVGLTVVLKDGGGNVLQTTTTGVNGFYQFTGLCGGNYTVDFPPPPPPPPGNPPLQHCPSFMGGNPALDSNPANAPVTLPDDNSNDVTIDHCYQQPACTGTIGDFVWNDMNANGIQEAGEPGIAGVTVRLRDQFNSVIATTSTNGSGNYQFSGLCGGNYSVVVDTTTLPPGFVASPTNAPGSTPANDNNPNPAPVTLPVNGNDPTIDFGYHQPVCTGQIGDFVWVDSNFNGIQDLGEPGLNGVVVELRRAGDNALLATTTTAGNGGYLFTGLCAGNYKIDLIPPTGYSSTLVNATGSTPANDSNPDPALVTLPNDNASDLTIDFGLVQAQLICVNDPTGTPVVVGALGWFVDAAGDVTVFWNQSTIINDNTYGTGSVGWGANAPSGKSHSFSSLTGSDNAQFRFKDASGNVKIEFILDYITSTTISPAFPSGYRSLGPNGGDGSMKVGSAANVLSWNTSLAKNLNNNGWCTGGNCLFAGTDLEVNSPPTVSSTSYALPAGSPFGNWIFPIQYEMKVAKAAFGASTFGSVQLVGAHNSPPKFGTNLLTPVPCPGGPQPPAQFCTNGVKPTQLIVKYMGGSCASSNNVQDDLGKSVCTDFGGGPGSASPVRILVTDKSNPTDGKAKKFYEQSVNLNGEFTVNSSAGGLSSFSSNTFFHIYEGTTLKETVSIHTSCSAPLNAGEQFGAIKLEGGK